MMRSVPPAVCASIAVIRRQCDGGCQCCMNAVPLLEIGLMPKSHVVTAGFHDGQFDDATGCHVGAAVGVAIPRKLPRPSALDDGRVSAAPNASANVNNTAILLQSAN